MSTDADGLWPLPEPQDVIIVGTQAMRAFTADQMRAYRAEGVAAERERLCEALKIAMQHSAWDGVLQLDDALLNIADALLGTPTAPAQAAGCAPGEG